MLVVIGSLLSPLSSKLKQLKLLGVDCLRDNHNLLFPKKHVKDIEGVETFRNLNNISLFLELSR